MPYTILILEFLAAQFLFGFVAAAVTANMSPQTVYWRRKVLRSLWAITGYALVAAIAYDVFNKM